MDYAKDLYERQGKTDCYGLRPRDDGGVYNKIVILSASEESAIPKGESHLSAPSDEGAVIELCEMTEGETDAVIYVYVTYRVKMRAKKPPRNRDGRGKGNLNEIGYG